jgi:hypothetical protein
LHAVSTFRDLFPRIFHLLLAVRAVEPADQFVRIAEHFLLLVTKPAQLALDGITLLL